MSDDQNELEGLSIQDLANSKRHLILKYKVDDRGCWLHKNKPNSDGYVCLFVGKKAYKAHRLSYALFKGDIPEGIMVCHTCDIRNCINPDHLFLGTNRDNIVDMYSKGRGNALTEDEIGFIYALRELKYSQEKIANMLGLSQASISNHLRTERYG